MRRKRIFASDTEHLLTLALRHAVEPSGLIRHHRLLGLVRGWNAARVAAAIGAAGLEPELQEPHDRGGARGRLYRAEDVRAALDRIQQAKPSPPEERRKVWE